MNHINSKCQYNGQSVTSGLKYQVMQIFGQSSLSIPNITSKFWQTDIFKPKFGLFFTFSKSAFKYWADLTITVFALHKCTGAQGLKVLALSEKADPRPGCSPERGAQSWCGGRLQVAPVTLLQAPLYVPLLGARHGGALQHSLHVPYLDDMVLTNSGQKLPPCVIAHVLHYVPGVKEVCPWSLLMVGDGDITSLAHPHRILVAPVVSVLLLLLQ